MGKSLLRDVFLVAVFSAITRILGFVFRIYLSRVLTNEMLGIYHVALSVFMVLVLLVSTGIPVTVSKMTARYEVKNDKKSVNRVATSSSILGLVISVIICLVVFLFQGLFSELFTDKRCMEILIILLPAVVVSSVYASLRGVFWGRKDYFTVGWTELLEQIVKIVSFILIFNLITTNLNSGDIVAIAITISCVVSALAVIFVYLKKGGKFLSPKGFFKPVLKSSTPITGVRTASSLIQPIISILFPMMLVIGGANKESALSIFGIAMGMTFPLLFLPSTLIGALSFALIPELSTALEKNNIKLVEERVRSGLIFSILVSSFLIPIFMGFGVEICKLLFDNSLSGEYLIWSSIIMIPIGLSNITSSILNAFNLEVKSFVNNILGGVLLIVCVVAFSSILQVYALVVGFGLCMTLTTGLNILMIKKHTNFKIGLLKPLLLSILFVVPSVFLGKWCYNIFLIALPNFVALIFGIGISCLTFFALCILFKLFDFTIFFSRINIFAKIYRKKHKIS